MSRTIRRKRHKTQYQHCVSHDERDWTWDQDYEYGYSVGRWSNYKTHWKKPKYQLQGKAYKQAWWAFHKDGRIYQTSYKWHWRNVTERKVRGRNKAELVKFWKNPDYEVISHKPECLSWWW